MNAPKRPAGEYFPARNHNVPIALSDGYGGPKSTRAEIVFIMFLARTTKGWETRGGSLSLDWVAARLQIPPRTLDRTIKRLRDGDVIEVTRTPTRATYALTDSFIRGCDNWVTGRRIANHAKLHKVMAEAPRGWTLERITRVHFDTMLEGDELLAELHRLDEQAAAVAAREHLKPVANRARRKAQ